MSKIIAIANQKGGVGKTTTSINLGIGLSKLEKKVCLIDYDPQGNSTQGLGYDTDNLSCSITTIMDRIIDKDFNITQDYGVLHHVEGIDLVPASIELAVMEMKLLSVYIGRERILKTYLDMIKPFYDYIIIDCKPSLDIMTLNALTAADEVLIPVKPQFYSAKGLEQLVGTINQVIIGGLNSNLKINGILFNLCNKRTNNFKRIRDIISKVYGKDIHMYNTIIPMAVAAEECPESGMSIYDYDPEGTVAKAYSDFTCEFIMREEGK